MYDGQGRGYQSGNVVNASLGNHDEPIKLTEYSSRLKPDFSVDVKNDDAKRRRLRGRALAKGLRLIWFPVSDVRSSLE